MLPLVSGPWGHLLFVFTRFQFSLDFTFGSTHPLQSLQAQPDWTCWSQTGLKAYVWPNTQPQRQFLAYSHSQIIWIRPVCPPWHKILSKDSEIRMKYYLGYKKEESLTIVICKQANICMNLRKLLWPHIHKCVINYSCLNTYCRAFTSTFYEKIMHFKRTSVCMRSLCSGCIMRVCLCVCVCLCLSLRVGKRRGDAQHKFDSKAVWVSWSICVRIHQFIYNYSTFVSGKTHTCQTHTHTHTHTHIASDWHEALLPSFISILRLPRDYCIHLTITQDTNISQL